MHYHIIGIAGNLTHNLALCLKKLGQTVTGSDGNFDEPMKSRLAGAGFSTTPGYDPEKIHSDIDCIILGMSMMLDNPELLKAQSLGLKVVSFPELIYDLTKDKKRIIVGGSHGKTTTTSMIMHVLKYQGVKFDWLVGSQVAGFDAMVGLSDDAKTIVIEGDEYPDSKINLKAKFLQYHHDIGILNGIERDHVNIYQTFESYLEVFRDFVKQTPPDGMLYYNASDSNVVAAIRGLPEIPKQAYFPHPYEMNGEICVALDQLDNPYPLTIFGEHNMVNMAAAKEICLNHYDITEKQFLTAMQSFEGSYIRLQCIHDTPSYKVYRDFAHSPSKLKASTEAIRQKYPNAHIIGCFELGTISSNNAEFLKQYENSYQSVDTALLFHNRNLLEKSKNQHIHGNFSEKEITEEYVRSCFGRNDIVYMTDNKEIKPVVDSVISNQQSVIVIMMSNSNFGKMEMETLFL